MDNEGMKDDMYVCGYLCVYVHINTYSCTHLCIYVCIEVCVDMYLCWDQSLQEASPSGESSLCFKSPVISLGGIAGGCCRGRAAWETVPSPSTSMQGDLQLTF